METIIFFTNWNSINRIKGNYKLSWTPADTDNVEAKMAIAEKIDVDKHRKFVFAFDGLQAGNLGKLVDLLEGSDVYLIYHTYPNKDILSNLSEQLNRAEIIIRGLIQSQHQVGHLYENVSKIDACKKDHDKEKLSSLFEEIKSHFIVKKENSEPIQIWKSLSLLGIKILNGSVNEAAYAIEVAKINGITEDFTVFSEFDNDLNKFWKNNNDKLYSIVKEANSNKINE